LSPWGNRRRSSPESGEAGGAPGRKGGGEGSRAHPSSILLVGWGGLMASEGARWHPASAAVAAGNSGKAKAELGNTRRRSFYAVQGRLRVAGRRREGARGGAQRGRANGDGRSGSGSALRARRPGPSFIGVASGPGQQMDWWQG
jgi:hypothetical protein